MGRPRTASAWVKDGAFMLSGPSRDGAKRWYRRWGGGDVASAADLVRAKAAAAELQDQVNRGTWDPWAPKLPAVPGEASPATDPAHRTVLEHCRAWVAAQTYGTASCDRMWIETHVAPSELGALPLVNVRPRDVAGFVRWLRSRPAARGGTLAPRSVRNVYSAVRRAFEAAVAEEVLAVTPCRLPRKTLPRSVDKHREFRARAVFRREEIVALCTDPGVPPDRRLFYTLLFCSGCRFGEAAALRWRAWDRTHVPLGQLVVSSSIETRTGAEKGTKTETPRLVPVHDELALALAAWWASGWAAHQGRAPTENDRIAPAPDGEPRDQRATHRQLQQDLTRLGLRARRIHDTRRTFISLCRDDGARGEVLQWVTHGGSPGRMVDLYTTLDWPTLCAEVACLRLDFAGPAGGSATDSATAAGVPSGNAGADAPAYGYMNRTAGHGPSPNAANSPPASDDDGPADPPGGRSATDSATAVALRADPLVAVLATPSATWALGDRALLSELDQGDDET